MKSPAAEWQVTTSNEQVRVRGLTRTIAYAACLTLAGILACAEPDGTWSVPATCPGRGAVYGVPLERSRNCLGELTTVACGRSFNVMTSDIGYAKHLPSETCYQFASGTLSRDLHDAPGWSDCSSGERALALLADYCPRLQFNLSSSHVRLSVDEQIPARIEFALDQSAIRNFDRPLRLHFSQRSIEDPDEKLGRFSERRVAVDEAGLAHTDFVCTQQGTALIEARLRSGGQEVEFGVREFLVAVDCDSHTTSGTELCGGATNCEAPTAECRVVDVEATERVAPGEEAALTIETESCPIGTPISLQVLSGTVGDLPSSPSLRAVLTTDDRGRASTSLLVGSEPGSIVLAVTLPFYTDGPKRLVLVGVGAGLTEELP